MAKEKLKRIANCISVALAICCVLMCSVFVPASASIEDGDRTTVLTAYGMFDTIQIDSFGSSQLPFFPYQLALNNASNTYSYVEFGTVTQPDGYDQLVFQPPTFVEESYPYQFKSPFSPPQNNASEFYVFASRGFVIDLDNWDNYEIRLEIPAHTSAYIEYDITCFVPVTLADGSVEYQRIVGAYYHQWENDSDGYLSVPVTTFKADVFGTYADKAKGLAYCTEHMFHVEASELYHEQMGQWTIVQKYADINNMPNSITLLERYPIIRNQQVGEIDLTGFLAGGLQGFWNFEVMPNMTMGGIIMMIVGVLTLFAILHLLR